MLKLVLLVFNWFYIKRFLCGKDVKLSKCDNICQKVGIVFCEKVEKM